MQSASDNSLNIQQLSERSIMVSNQWNLERSNIPESMECSGTALIFTLAKCTQPWQRIKTVEEILQHCGLDPFAEVLDVPKSGILGEYLPESARKPHPNLLFRALAIQAFGKMRDVQLESEIAAKISDFSKNLLTVLEQEARSGATPLIRWSAAVSIRSIWQDEAGERHGNDSSVNVRLNAPEIELLITEEQIKLLLDYRIYRDSNAGNGSVKQFENSLDFWVYGPSWLLFSLQMDCEEYLFWLDRLFAAIAVTDVQYGFNNSENDATVKKFLESIENNFDEADFSKILAKIFEFIQHPESRVKDEAATLLEPYKDRLDRKSTPIMKALAYKVNLESQRLESLTIPEIEDCKASLENYKIEIDGVYSEALSVCDDRDAEMAKFLSAKHVEYQNTVEEQSNNLSKLIKSIIDCQGLLDANRELLYLTVERLQTEDYTLGNKLTAHQKKLQSLGVDRNTCEQCINLESELNSLKDSLQYTLYEVTSKINSKIRELELSASKNNKTASDMFKWTWVLLGVWFSVGLFLYLSDSVINSLFNESYYQTEFLIYWTVFFIVIVMILLILAIFFSTIAALEKRKESKLIPKFDNLSQIASNFSSMWQKSYLQQFVPSVRSN